MLVNNIVIGCFVVALLIVIYMIYKTINEPDEDGYRKLPIKFKPMYLGVRIPYRASEGAAGCDLYAYVSSTEEDIAIKPHETAVIETGISLEIPEGYFGAIVPRSGFAIKSGIGVINSPGIIDEDYRGQIKVGLHNYNDDETFYVKNGDRIAQILFIPYEVPEFLHVVSLGGTSRGENGFGSTGKD